MIRAMSPYPPPVNPVRSRTTALGCNDHDVCTDDACDPVLGCVNVDNSVRCDDGDSCTTDSCDPGIGCVSSSAGSCGVNPRGIGYWKRLCRGPHPSGDFYASDDVACVAEACPLASVTSIAALCDVLTPDPPSDPCAKAEQQLLALMLNLCRGRVGGSETIHPSCGDAATVAGARAAIDEALCDPSRTAADCQTAACAAEEIVSGHALGVTSLRALFLSGGGVSLTWSPPHAADDSGVAPRYRVWRRPTSESAFVQIAETHDLAFADVHAPASGAQYEVSVVW